MMASRASAICSPTIVPPSSAFSTWFSILLMSWRATARSRTAKLWVTMNSWFTVKSASSMPGPAAGGYSLTERIAPNQLSRSVRPWRAIVRRSKTGRFFARI